MSETHIRCSDLRAIRRTARQRANSSDALDVAIREVAQEHERLIQERKVQEQKRKLQECRDKEQAIVNAARIKAISAWRPERSHCGCGCVGDCKYECNNN